MSAQQRTNVDSACACNRITMVGAQVLAEVLKVNKTVTWIDLASACIFRDEENTTQRIDITVRV